MKKIIAIMVTAMLVFTACGSDNSEQAIENETSSDSTQVIEAPASESESDEIDPDDSDSGDSDADDSDSGDSDEISPEFKKTMDDYEAWFDHYCEVMKKYQEDPSDMELLTEMTSLLSEETEMLDQMENMDESEMTNAELAYYLEVTARIEKKLLEVANY